MARPTKQGIDYYPLDCSFDDKTEMYIIEKGATGLAVLVTLWQMIYSGHGYYIEDTEDLHLLIKRRIDVGINEVSDCINACLRRNLFDKNMHKHFGILTSKAIQHRFFVAAKKKKTISVVEEYVIKEVSEIINRVSGGNNWVFVDGNATKEEEEENKRKSKDKNNRSNGFDLFWSVYPKKVKKKQSAAKWKTKHLADKADMIITDVQNRIANDARWKAGYIPDPTTYLNGERWDDEIETQRASNENRNPNHESRAEGIWNAIRDLPDD